MNSTTVDENVLSTKSNVTADETFTTLAMRSSSTTMVDGNSRQFDKTAFCSLDDSGEFTMPHENDPNK